MIENLDGRANNHCSSIPLKAIPNKIYYLYCACVPDLLEQIYMFYGVSILSTLFLWYEKLVGMYKRTPKAMPFQLITQNIYMTH